MITPFIDNLTISQLTWFKDGGTVLIRIAIGHGCDLRWDDSSLPHSTQLNRTLSCAKIPNASLSLQTVSLWRFF